MSPGPRPFLSLTPRTRRTVSSLPRAGVQGMRLQGQLGLQQAWSVGWHLSVAWAAVSRDEGQEEEALNPLAPNHTSGCNQKNQPWAGWLIAR